MSARPAKQIPPAGGAAEGTSEAVEAFAGALVAHGTGAGKGRDVRRALIPPLASFRACTGRLWRYTGKRARVLSMLATSRAGGVTQWDTLPWHTRLGGTIHAMRRDGLEISTTREGPCRHARYRLTTPGALDAGGAS